MNKASHAETGPARVSYSRIPVASYVIFQGICSNRYIGGTECIIFQGICANTAANFVALVRFMAGVNAGNPLCPSYNLKYSLKTVPTLTSLVTSIRPPSETICVFTR